jgi:Uma2 family endonuclease
MTAKTDVELEDQTLNLDEEDEEFEKPYYFYDDDNNYWRLREELGDMPSAKHNDLVDYLKQVLLWLYRLEGYQVNREINFYETTDRMEKPLYPDIFVLKSTEEFPQERGYRLLEDGPPPQVVIEVLSENTASNDLKVKPGRYAKWGVAEYFVYDPRKRVRRSKKPRLSGWRLLVSGKYQKLKADEQGRIWSEQLESWLVPDEALLRLYDREWNLRLSKADAEEQAKDAALQREEVERWEKEAALQREAALRQVAEAERQAKEAALAREANMRQELERMAEKLRQLEQGRNINSD